MPVNRWHLVAAAEVSGDVAGAIEWYEATQPKLARKFLVQLRGATERIATNPFQFQLIHKDIRRAMLHNFPYAVFFAVQADHVALIAIDHTKRDPAGWQKRRDNF